MNINFERIIRDAKIKYNRNPNVSENFERSIKFAIDYISRYIAEHPNLTKEDLIENVLMQIHRKSQEFINISIIKEFIYRSEWLESFIANPNEIDRLSNYETASNTESEKEKREYVLELVKAVKKMKNDNRRNIELMQKYRDGDPQVVEHVEKRMRLTPEQKKKLEKEIKVMLKDDLGTMKELLPEAKTNNDIFLREAYTKILDFLKEFFEDNGLIYKYINTHNSRMKNIGLSNLSVSKEEFEEESAFNKENLEKMKLQELARVVAFWLNRYTKENENLNTGILAIHSLNLWQDIIDGKREFDIDYKKLEAAFCISEFMKKSVSLLYNETIKKRKNNQVEVVEKIGDVEILDTQDLIDSIEEQVRVSFYNEFAETLPEAQVDDSFAVYMPLYNMEINAYLHKSEIIETQILELMKNKKVKNWGYIEENNNSNMILIGIDIEGYNMPIKLHMRKNNLVKTIKKEQIEPIIPIYEGHEDMIIDGQLLTTQVLMNLSKDRKKQLRELSDNSEKRVEIKRFLEHLIFLRDSSKFPKHLKNKDGIREKKFINIETGEKMIQDQKGCYIIEERKDVDEGR